MSKDCKHCGLLKSTVEETNVPCMRNKGTYHEFEGEPTMSKETWEDEFELLRHRIGYGISDGDMDDEIKTFISNAIQESVLEERRRISAGVEKMKVPTEELQPFSEELVAAYSGNGTIDEVLALINKDK